jgi:hypothetical protein
MNPDQKMFRTANNREVLLTFKKTLLAVEYNIYEINAKRSFNLVVSKTLTPKENVRGIQNVLGPEDVWM